MTLATLLVLLHGDDSRLELLYFWAAILIVATPLLILGSIGWLVVRKAWKERQEENAEVGMRNAELK